MPATDINVYDLGDLVTISTLITVGSVPTDPTTLTLYIKEPDLNILTVVQGSLTQNDTGDWEYEFSPTKVGKHYYRWAGDTPAQGAEETPFLIRESQFS